MIINMKYSKLLVLISTVFIISPGAAIAVYAQEIPEGVRGPSAEEISQFEKEFGAPPEALTPKGAEFEKPKFEQPGKVPDEVKQYVSDKDLIGVYCATVRWKSGSFFIALDAVKKYVVPGIEKVKELGIDVSLPDLESIRSEGTKKIDNICNAKTIAEAENLVQEFSSWGQNEASAKFDNLRGDLEAKVKAKGDELKAKIKSEIDPYVAEERAKIESELRQYGEQLGSQKQAELAGSKTPPNVGAIQNEIQQQVMAQVEGKKAAMKEKIQAKINSLMGGQKEKFEEIGKLFENVGSKINAEIASRQNEYDQYKQEAFRLRKELVFKILDKNLEEGLKQLDAAESDIETARKEDSSIESVNAIKARIQQDRKALESKLDAALEDGNEAVFQQALNDFKMKWEGFRQDMEKTASQSVSKACTIALAQLDKAKAQIDSNLPKIKDLQSRCSGSAADECQKVNEFSPRFNTLTTKLTDIKIEMGLAEKMCQTPETADRKNLIALMKKIQSDGEDVKVYGEALEAEKSKVIADSAQKVCAQVLPQLTAAKTEIAKNDITILRNNLEKCRAKTTEECNVINQLSSKFSQFESRANDFSNNIAQVELLCQSADEGKFEQLRTILNQLKGKGNELKLLGKELQAEQAEKAGEKTLCRAANPRLDIAKGNISAGLNEMSSMQSSCKGKTDERCAWINSAGPRFAAIQNQASAILKKISDVNLMCQNAGTGEPRSELLALLDSLKTDENIIKKAITDLKDGADRAAKGKGIWIEAESAIKFNTRTGVSNPMAREVNPRWRPPYFGDGTWYMGAGGDYLTYEFNIPQAGKYFVWVRDYVDKFQARGIRRIIMEFDGERFGVFPEANIPAPGDKGAIGWHKVGDSIEFNQGKHAMKIIKESSTAGAAILDAFYFTTGSEVPPEK